MPEKLTHVDAHGAVHMVDISEKSPTKRKAVAGAVLTASREAIAAILSNSLGKGDALATARIAGIMAAKRTAELLPLCHPLALTRISIDISATSDQAALRVTALAETVGPTGVEMEALTAASIAALTLYDMAKSIDKSMTITDIALLEKTGGESGDFFRKP